MCMAAYCAPCTCSPCGGQKRVSGAIELKVGWLWAAWCGVGNQTRVFCKNYWATLPGPTSGLVSLIVWTLPTVFALLVAPMLAFCCGNKIPNTVTSKEERVKQSQFWGVWPWPPGSGAAVGLWQPRYPDRSVELSKLCLGTKWEETGGDQGLSNLLRNTLCPLKDTPCPTSPPHHGLKTI